MRLVKTALAILVVSVFAGRSAPAQEKGIGGSTFHKNDITYSTRIETPHVEWATKLPGGPIKGFFIPSICYGRDMVELMQRLHLEPTTVSIDRHWDINCWGIGDYYSHRYRGDRDDFRIVYGYVEKDITGPANFEVMVIPGLNGWSRMTRKTRDAILRRVQDGAGLVLIHPFVGDVKGHPFKGDEPEGDIRIWDISPLVNCLDDSINDGGYPEVNRAAIGRGKWEIVKRHFITANLPLDLLPEGNIGGSFYKYEANGDVLVESGDYPVIAVRNYGSGRVVALAYENQGFIPRAVDPVKMQIYRDYWEYYYSLLARCVLWASGRDIPVRLTALEATRGESPKIEIDLGAVGPAKIEIVISAKSEFGPTLGSYTVQKDLVLGENPIEIAGDLLRPKAGWPGGRIIFDVIVRDAGTGTTFDWGTTVYEMQREATLTMIRTSTDICKRGEALGATVEAAGDLAGLSVRFKVTDEFDRVVASTVKPASSEVAFSCPLADYIGHYACVNADLVDASGRVVDERRAKPVLVVQGKRRPREFKALVSFAGGRPFFTNIRGQLVHAAGAEPGFIWGGTVNTGLAIPQDTFGVYWYHRGPFDKEGIEKAIAEYKKTGNVASLKYNVKKELYKRTGDKKFLVRTPCLNDPVFMKSLADTVRETARKKAKYNFDYYFVGDEGSLTSYTDNVDFCWGPHTLAAFRKWLTGKYGSLDALNKEWKTAYKDWISVVPYTTKEALETGDFAPWADHRTFMEITFADAYRQVRDAVCEGDPDAHIAVSGTQVTKAYNGCDWYRLDSVIDDFLSYSGGNQWDIHRSFAKPGSMIGFWTGYGRRGIAVQHEIWAAAVNGVLYPNIFWMYSYLNPDFTYSDSARDMGKAFKALKFEGIAKLLMESKRLSDGIALHYSIASVHAASITSNEREHGRKPENVKRNFSADRDGWVRTMKELDLQFDFVSYDQLEKGSLSSGNYRVFIMPFSMALSPKEVRAIRAFADAGGIVIADAAAGLMDEHCSWREEGLLNDFFGIKPAASSKRGFPGVTGEVVVSAKGKKWGLDAESLSGIEAAEKDLGLSDATALVAVAGSPAVLVRRAGRGWAIYLNILYDRLSGPQGDKTRREAYRGLAGALLGHLKVTPAVEVLAAGGKPLEDAVVARYRIGDCKVLAIVKANVAINAIEGRDGVTVYDDSKAGKIAKQEITIRLPKAYHVTNVRTGEDLGFTEVVKQSIVVGGSLILALSPVENSIQIKGPTKAAPGEHPAFTITSKALGKRIARCHFFAPDGSFVPIYAKTIVLDAGAGKVVLSSAVNDPPGTWILKVTDILTGAAAEATVTLE